MASVLRATVPRVLPRTVRAFSSGTKVSATVGPVSGFCGAVGNTPLIRINSLSNETGCEIYGKAEFMAPGGSVKDRAALYIVLDAEKEQILSLLTDHERLISMPVHEFTDLWTRA